MKIEQLRWSSQGGWAPRSPGSERGAQLVLVFGGRALLDETGTASVIDELKRSYPDAYLAGCSTAGEISGDRVYDDTVVTTAITFEHGSCLGVSVELAEGGSSEDAGTRLVGMLPDHDKLRHVLVFSDGLHVNGSELVKGLTRGLPPKVFVTGGLAGDGPRFESTCVVANGPARRRVIVAVGLYGAALHVGFGSMGGWDPFGPERVVTRSKGNVLYALDGQSALALYKRYLGDQARDLPGSGLLFPLSLRIEGSDQRVVRTILSVSDTEDSMTFAGDLPEGARAQLMRANFDRLIDGAIGAARVSAEGLGTHQPECALLISCVGRKMMLQQRIEEEVEGVREIVGASATLAGFYSYGEIGPFGPDVRCELHNQTMTVTSFSER